MRPGAAGPAMSSARISGYLQEIRALLAIAWPMMIAQLAQMGTGVVDTIMAGHYSAADLAAIAIGYNIWLPLFLLVLGVMLAATAIVAQDFGAGLADRIRRTLPQSLWLALLLGLIAGPLCYNAAPLLDLLGLEPGTRDKSLAYLQAVAFGLPASALFQALRCHSQGIGIMRPFATASVIAFFANIPLNYALIYGRFGLPEMGAAGCGWATAISMWLAFFLIALSIFRSRELKPYLPPARPVAPDPARIAEISALGFPIGLTFFMEISVFSVIALLIATLGDTAMAAHQIAFNIYDVLYMPLISIGSGMSTRVGHAIGSRDRPGLLCAVSCGTAMSILVGVVGSLVLLTLPETIIRAYTTDASIREMAAYLLRLAALFVIIDSMREAAAFCLRAFKDTRFPFMVTCLVYWLITLPVGYWLGIVKAEGAAGFWHGMILGTTIGSALIIWRVILTLRRPLTPEPVETG